MNDYFYVKPSITEGVGRTIDLFGIMSNDSSSLDGAEADLNALSNDIAVLKSDFLESYQEIIGEYSR